MAEIERQVLGLLFMDAHFYSLGGKVPMGRAACVIGWINNNARAGVIIQGNRKSEIDE